MGHLMWWVGAVILRTGTVCCALHRLAQWAVHCTDWHLMLCTAQNGTMGCALHKLAPYAVHRTEWHLMLCTAQTGTLCCAPHRLAPYAVHRTDWHLMLCTAQTGSPYMYVQKYQRILRRRFPSLSSAVPGKVRADCQSADAVLFHTL